MKYFKLFASCQLIEGSIRSAIFDLERQQIRYMPVELAKIIDEAKNHSVANLSAKYNSELYGQIIAIFDLLVNEEFAFYTNTPERFPELSKEWRHPSIIRDAVIEINGQSDFDISNLIQQLNHLGCESLHLRYYSHVGIDDLRKISDEVKDLRMKWVEIFIPYRKEFSSINYDDFLPQLNQRLRRIVFHGAHVEGFLKTEYDTYKHVVYFAKQVLNEASIREYDDERFFILSIKNFMEAQQYNLGLNRKVSISPNGDIRNYSNHKKSFGNVLRDQISDVVKMPEFQEKWHITKDQIQICKECEYRYVCPDNRDIHKADDGSLSLISPCAYNPYTGEWAIA